MSKQKNDMKVASVLKALVIADSFTNEFKPITITQPKITLPLVNVPIIEYILEFLATSGVEEIYVLVCSNFNAIINYLKYFLKVTKKEFKMDKITQWSFSETNNK
jgi:translation initiation factor eIF-2B subunit epsilon